MWVMNCLGYNNRYIYNKSDGYDVGMLNVCMLRQGYDLPKELQHKIMLITKKS